MKHNKNIIIANWAGVNTGDDAIFTVLLNIVSQNISNDASIYVLADNDKLIKSKYNINDAIRIFDFYKLHNLKKLFRFLRASHLVIYGGGDIISGNIESISFIALALIVGLPVMCCGVGVIPIKSPLKRFFTKFVLNRVTSITVRDEESKQRLDLMRVIKPKVIVTSDLAFLLSPNPNCDEILQKIRIDKTKLKIGVCIRPFSSMYDFYGFWRDKLLIKDIGVMCDYLTERFDATIIFIPMVIKERTKYYHKNLEADDELCNRIINSMTNKGRVILLKEDYTPNEVIWILNQMQLVIAARLHALLLGALGEVPVIAIEYAPKIKSFMTSINRSNYSININELSQKKLKETIDQALKEKDVINSNRLKSNIVKAKMNANEIEKMIEIAIKKRFRLYLFLPATIIIALLNYLYSAVQIVLKKKYFRNIIRDVNENNFSSSKD